MAQGQWINKIDDPLTEKEKRVLQIVRNGRHRNHHTIGKESGISSAHVNNILTKLSKRGLIEKVWVVKESERICPK